MLELEKGSGAQTSELSKLWQNHREEKGRRSDWFSGKGWEFVVTTAFNKHQTVIKWQWSQTSRGDISWLHPGAEEPVSQLERQYHLKENSKTFYFLPNHFSYTLQSPISWTKDVRELPCFHYFPPSGTQSVATQLATANDLIYCSLHSQPVKGYKILHLETLRHVNKY